MVDISTNFILIDGCLYVLIILVLLDKDLQKSGLLFKLTKTSRSFNSSRVSFL